MVIEEEKEIARHIFQETENSMDTMSDVDLTLALECLWLVNQTLTQLCFFYLLSCCHSNIFISLLLHPLFASQQDSHSDFYQLALAYFLPCTLLVRICSGWVKFTFDYVLVLSIPFEENNFPIVFFFLFFPCCPF